MTASDRAALHLLISGRVQGVWFRGSMQAEARRLGLTGWARNLADGRVEALVEGPLAELAAIRDWTVQGPPGARVDSVEAQDRPASGLEGFKVR